MKVSSTPICVVGAGTMGRGIAQVALTAGHPVSLVDAQSEPLLAAAKEIEARLTRRQPTVAAELSARLGTFSSITDVPPHPDTVVIEAVLENLDAKIAVFREAAGHFGSRCVLATNTSSLSVTAIAAGSPQPERVVGMHFFNPVPVMKLVEVVTGLQTDPKVAEQIATLATAWGKEVAHVRSAPGFIVNRVARGFYGEALRLVEEQVAQPRTIDALMRSAGFRMGPFELMDLIGNDVNSAVTRSVWTAFNFDPRFEPSRVQDELVAAGRYGRKSGRGFYSYGEDESEVESPAVVPPGYLPDTVELTGESAELEIILDRSGVSLERADADGGYALLAGGVALRVTRGQSAAIESAKLGGIPVVLLDRWISPAGPSALAVSASDRSALGPVAALLSKAGIAAVEVADSPGMVLARTLAVIANEAWETTLHGVATPPDIDKAMELGTNYPSGPFSWTEQWGPGVVEELLDGLWGTYHDTRYRASRALRDAASAVATRRD